MSTTIFVSFPLAIREQHAEAFVKFAKKNGIQYLPVDEDTEPKDALKNKILLRFKDTAKFNLREDKELYRFIDWQQSFGYLLFVQMQFRREYDTRYAMFLLDSDGQFAALPNENAVNEWRDFVFPRVAEAMKITAGDHMRPDYASGFLPNDRKPSPPHRFREPNVRNALNDFVTQFSKSGWVEKADWERLYNFVKVSEDESGYLPESHIEDHLRAKKVSKRTAKQMAEAYAHLRDFYAHLKAESKAK